MIRSGWPRGIALPRLRCLITGAQSFASSCRPLEKALPPRPKIVETDIEESFLKGSGPGGQKINKTSSAVQIKHLPTGIVVKSQETRSRQQNRKLARQVLAEKLDLLEKGDQSRTAIKADRARVKKASASKKRNRKYKKLAEEKAAKGETQDSRNQHSGGGEHSDNEAIAAAEHSGFPPS